MESLYEIILTREFGDPGDIILAGLVSVDVVGRKVSIERTGPYVPNIATSNGVLICTPVMREALIGEWGRWLQFVEVNVTKVVRFNISYDKLDDIFDMYRGEPEDIIEKGENDDDLRERIGILYAAFPLHVETAVGYDISQLKSGGNTVVISGLNRTTISDIPIFRLDINGSMRICCSESTRKWLIREQGAEQTIGFYVVETPN